MGENKVTKAIEDRFRNRTLEERVCGLVVRVFPALASTVKPEWFSIQPLAQIVRVASAVRTQMTAHELEYQLRAAKAMNGHNSDVMETYLKEIYKVDVDVEYKTAQLMARQLSELFESRMCLDSLKGIVADLKSFSIGDVKKRLRELGNLHEFVDPSLAGDYLDDYEARRDALLLRRDTRTEDAGGIVTGIAHFDQLTGGLMPGEFGVVAGAPAVGKTAMLVSLAINAWLAGRSVLFVSGEMSKELIESRMDSNLAGIASQKFRMGTLEQADLDKWHTAMTALRSTQQSFLEIVSFSRNFTTSLIEAAANRIQDRQGKRIDLICIDYINIMDSASGFGNNKDWKNQADAVWDVKALTAELNGGISIWTAGQIRDEFIAADELTLEALKYARAISETAPVVVGLVRTPDDVLYNTLQLQVLKMRNAPIPKRPIILHPDLNVMRINRESISRKCSLDDEYEPREASRKKEAPRRRGRL